jgi:hypothetical protein
MTDSPLVEVHRYPFSKAALADIQHNVCAGTNWPLVYILSDGKNKQAYVGETTDTLTRLSTHLKHDEKRLLTSVHLISSDRFNKSATLDIEFGLIKYMAADGVVHCLLSGNLGLVDHNYYQRDELYNRVFAYSVLHGTSSGQKALYRIRLSPLTTPMFSNTRLTNPFPESSGKACLDCFTRC